MLPNDKGMVHPRTDQKTEMYVDIGAYGEPKVPNFHPRETTRKIEQFVRKNNGLVLTLHNFFVS